MADNSVKFTNTSPPEKKTANVPFPKYNKGPNKCEQIYTINTHTHTYREIIKILKSKGKNYIQTLPIGSLYNKGPK